MMFMMRINNVLWLCLRKFVVVYLDDVLVYSKNESDHEKHLELVLQKLQENKLYANLNKCEFGKNTIKYLGHVVSADGIWPDLSKTKVIWSKLILKTIWNIQSFLGLANYYWRFIKDFTWHAKLLTALLWREKTFE